MIRARLPLPSILLAAILLIFAAPQIAQAQLKIDITRGNVEPLPIALIDYQGDVEEAARIGADITAVITADLERSGLFRPIARSAFIETDLTSDVQPRFADWRLINAQALMTGSVRLLVDGRLRVEFRLWDIFAGQQLVGKAFETPPENWRRVSHIIADEIYRRLTGESGYFDTRIVYVSESGPQDARVKRLAIMDQDGAGHRYLTNGRHLVLTPRFSPTTQEITYMSYINNRPRVYLFNIDTGQQEVLGDFPGMTFAPRFSPDGNQVIMSMASGGNSEIYTMDLRTRQVRRLTNSPAIDTSPSMSPDGNQITFNSDRGGSPQIYVMNGDGSNVRRITFGKGQYLTPVWSPRGDLISFTKILQGRFFVGVIRPDGSGERLLAEDFLVESPTWAPNGRVLMFFRQQPSDANGQGGDSKLYSIDLTGYNEREVETPLDASDPAWSPLIP